MIHLHWHSHYSLLSAIWTPKDIENKAKELGQKAIAITDFNVGYALLEFYEKVDGIKPILWTDINFSYDGENMMNIVLLAKNYEWYLNLIKLISIANTENNEKYPYLKMDNLKKYSKWLIWISWWNWEIEKLIIWNDDEDIILDKISEYEEIFDWDFYLEFLTYEYEYFLNRQKIEENFIKFIKEHNKKWIISSNFKYINKEDKDTYDVLLCIKNNEKYGWERKHIIGDHHIMSEKEVREIMLNNGIENDMQDLLIENTHKIEESIDCKIPLHQLLFPKYEIPEKYKKLYDSIK